MVPKLNQEVFDQFFGPTQIIEEEKDDTDDNEEKKSTKLCIHGRDSFIGEFI